MEVTDENISLMNSSTMPNNSDKIFGEGGVYHEVIVVLSQLQKYTNPVFCAFGILANFVAMTVFLSKSQRKTSCSLYLAARSMSDSGFLLALFVVWLSDVRVNAFNIPVICQLVVFLTYICGFLSVWFVVAVTAENCVRICHPFEVNKYCTTKIAKITVFVFVTVAMLLYNFPLWTINVTDYQGQRVCLRNPGYDVIHQMLNYIDTLVTLVIPTILIISLMIAITVRVLKIYHRKRIMQGKRVDRKSSNPQGKVTRMLFSVSVIFIVLNLPSHAVRIYMTICNYVLSRPEWSVTEKAAHYIFQTMYYLNFSVNIFVYLVFGTKFRSEFVRIYFSRFQTKRKTPVTQYEKITLVDTAQQCSSTKITDL